MKRPIAFLKVLLDELGRRCGVSTIQDWKTVLERYEHEGWSFFTITLPTFSRDLEKGLENGFVGHDQYRSFSRYGELPRFLGGFLDLVFDRKTGRLLDFPSVDAIYAIRQFSLACGKMELECTVKRTHAAMLRYVECEQDVKRFDKEISANNWEVFDRVGSLLWRELFSHVDESLHAEYTLPKHSSGSTADGLRGNMKYNQKVWTSRLEEEFPAWRYLFSSFSSNDELDAVHFLEPGQELPVKVIPVPKTQKTPRIIAMEPTCMQYTQQSILELLVHEMVRDNHASHFISSEDQIPNREMARFGSRSKEQNRLATLDLSDASDRVSYQHVLHLLRRNTLLRGAVDACRSRKADVPGFGVLRLAKFASMGSALCFPFEALVFCTIVFVGIERSLRRRLTERDILSLFGQVRVYGDDIIVPVCYAQTVVNSLHDFGLVVNRSKSFWNGYFRESCGGDYYDGYDVSVTRIRRMLPTSRRDVSEVVAAVSLRNHLYEAGFEASVDYLDEMIGEIIPFPQIESLTSPLLGRLTYGPVLGTSVDNDLQVPLVRGARVVSTLPTSELDGYGALMKYFLRRGNLPSEDEMHLHRAGRPVSARIKIGMAPPF